MKSNSVPESCATQLVPLVEVMIAPPSPTATNAPFPNVTLFMVAVVGKGFRRCQVSNGSACAGTDMNATVKMSVHVRLNDLAFIRRDPRQACPNKQHTTRAEGGVRFGGSLGS